MEKQEVPIWEKANLTIDEAAAYFGIGTNKLREITSNPDCEFVIRVGAKRLIKRKKFREILGRRGYSVTNFGWKPGCSGCCIPGFATGKLQKTY